MRKIMWRNAVAYYLNRVEIKQRALNMLNTQTHTHTSKHTLRMYPERFN